ARPSRRSHGRLRPAPRRLRSGRPCPSPGSRTARPSARRECGSQCSPRRDPQITRRTQIEKTDEKEVRMPASLNLPSTPGPLCHLWINCLVHTDRSCCRDLVERSHPADAVPWVLLARRLALALVALGEPRDEELLRQGRQEHAAGLPDLD